MEGKIKVINGIYPLTLDKAIKHEINLNNVDRILIAGDSYVEGMYYQKGKAWVCQFSEQLDYNIEAWGFGGNTYEDLIKRLVNNEKRYNSIGVRDLKATKVICASYANDMKTGRSDLYLENLEKFTNEVEKMGAIPIITSCWRNPWGMGNEIALSGFSDLKGYEFWNILPITTFLGIQNASDNAEFKPFFSGSHPAQRTGGIILNNYLKYAKNLPRPNSSIKIYRSRSSLNTLEELNYSNKREKLLSFKEINIAHSCLELETDWDNVSTPTGRTVVPVQSEYGKLMNNENVEFSKYALIEVVFPTTSNNLNDVTLNLKDLTGHTLYVKTNKGFIEIQNNTITSELINSCMEYDKIAFLVYKESGFTLNHISIQWTGLEVVKHHYANREILQKGTEKLNKNKFDDLSGITAIGSLTPSTPTNYTVLPTGCTKIITINNENYFKVAVNKSSNPVATKNNVVIRIVARYNPVKSDPAINSNSYDRKELELKIKGQHSGQLGTNSFYSLKQEVDMAWTLCEFNVELNENTELIVKSVDNTNLEIAYISVLEV